MKQQFAPGAMVRLTLRGPGDLQSSEERPVLRVDEDGGVWLDNGKGNDPTGPFVDGKMPPVFGTYLQITAL